MANSGLSELQGLLAQLDSNRAALAGGPRKIAEAQAAIAKQEQEIEAAKHEQQNLQKAADQKNLQFNTNKQKVIDQKSKLGMCKTNVEYEILTRQMDSELKANDQLESEYLEILVKIDEYKAKVVEFTKALEAKKANLVKIKADVAAAEPGLKAAVTKYEQLSAVAAASCIPNEHLSYYKRLIAQQGADSITPAIGGSCEGCFSGLPPQATVNLRMGQVVLCRECGRFLYHGG